MTGLLLGPRMLALFAFRTIEKVTDTQIRTFCVPESTLEQLNYKVKA